MTTEREKAAMDEEAVHATSDDPSYDVPSRPDEKPLRISRRLRFEILRRDDFTCRYCGGRAPEIKLTVDHVKPASLGGTNEPDNLVAACDGCNGGKGSIAPDSPLVADVSADALRWARAVSFVADVFEEKIAEQDEITGRFDSAWDVWFWSPRGEQQPLPRPSNWRSSIVRFHALGLRPAILEHLLQIAMGKDKGADTWRYFCGCCWRTLDQMHADAAEILGPVEGVELAEIPDDAERF